MSAEGAELKRIGQKTTETTEITENAQSCRAYDANHHRRESRVLCASCVLRSVLSLCPLWFNVRASQGLWSHSRREVMSHLQHDTAPRDWHRSARC